MNANPEASRALLSAALLTVALAGCSLWQAPPKIDPNLYPIDYKNEIIQAMPTLAADPTGLRDAAVTDLAMMPVGSDSRYFACVRYMPRRAQSERDTGPVERIAVYYGGRLNQFAEATREQCGKAAYRPFPELEQACAKKNCN
jgi:hypothetical protein